MFVNGDFIEKRESGNFKIGALRGLQSAIQSLENSNEIGLMLPVKHGEYDETTNKIFKMQINRLNGRVKTTFFRAENDIFSVQECIIYNWNYGIKLAEGVIGLLSMEFIKEKEFEFLNFGIYNRLLKRFGVIERFYPWKKVRVENWEEFLLKKLKRGL